MGGLFLSFLFCSGACLMSFLIISFFCGGADLMSFFDHSQMNGLESVVLSTDGVVLDIGSAL